MNQNIGDSQTNYVDLAWDYLPIYRKLLELQCEMRLSTNFIITEESATPESRSEIHDQLERIIQKIRILQEKLKSGAMME